MPLLNQHDSEELVYSHAMDACAAGIERSTVLSFVAQLNIGLSIAQVNALMDEALDGARSIGVEIEDIDGSWLS